MKDIIKSISAVDSLLAGPSAKKKRRPAKKAKKKAEAKTTPLPAKKKAKKQPVKKASFAKTVAKKKAAKKTTKKVRARVKPGKKLTAAQRKMLAQFGNKPNLKKLNKLISRGVMSADEVVMAVEEALKLKVNARIAETIAEALRDVFGVGEIIDVGDVPLARR
jgi:hypothetical protein